MMEEARKKAQALTEALPYIKRFKNRFVVVKLGGSAQDDPEILKSIFTDCQILLAVGIRPVIVYGGGRKISGAMKESGRSARFIHGQRVTDAAAIDIVARVLCDEVGRELLGLLREAGGLGFLLNGRDHAFLRAIKKTLPEAPGVDLGFVGEPVAIDATPIHNAFEQRHWPDGKERLPLIAPLACGCGRESGVLYNVNGDTAAAQIARDLHAEKLVFISDISGIYRDKNDPAAIFPHLDRREVMELVRGGVVAGGMIPKVEACVFALEGGVDKAHIVAGALPHALLLEIFTISGIGTEIVLERQQP
ncbi:MAG: acetylglutamate kinase [Planctomycetota bacterium]|jgi:acetylglutamate kinase|nr:acetylglutamate kinase [Planctomycetota bacterium]